MWIHDHDGRSGAVGYPEVAVQRIPRFTALRPCGPAVFGAGSTSPTTILVLIGAEREAWDKLVGVPAVLTGTASVFATPTAAQWPTLLEALEQRQRTARVRRDLLRIETLPSYDTAVTSPDFRRWLDGAAEPTWSVRQP